MGPTRNHDWRDDLPKVGLWEKLARLGFGLPCLDTLFEILQVFVPGREAAAGDALANTIGVAIGLTPFVIVQLGRIVRGFPARPERI